MSSQRRRSELALLGFGLGLRPEHYRDILERQPPVDWFEIVSENYMAKGGKPRWYAQRIRHDYPLVLHGVSLSIGSTDPLDTRYLTELKDLAADLEPEWISDHLCWTSQGGDHLHDLFPLPYTGEAVSHVADRVRQVQDFLGRQLLLENVSSYVTYRDSGMTEWEFVSAVAEEADSLILLDVNNVYVSSVNHGYDPATYLHGIPAHRVQQIHLAGHTEQDGMLIDTHDRPVADPVWDLYAEALALCGPVSTMIEWDDRLPSLDRLLEELQTARNVARERTAVKQCLV